jgi:membrane-associated phospholipid phosphatase
MIRPSHLIGLCALLAASPVAQAGDDSQTRLGDVLSYALPAATLGTELWRGDTSGAGQFTAAFLATMGTTEVLKRTTGVERPDGSNDESFPSGHAARAFAAATYVHRRHGLSSAWPLYAMATYVGYTRVQADRHRWVDVLGAAGVSAASSWWLVEPKQPPPGVAGAPRGISVSFTLPLR